MRGNSLQRLAAFTTWAFNQQVKHLLAEGRWVTSVMVGRNRAVTFRAELYRLNADGTETNDCEKSGELTIWKSGSAEAMVWSGSKLDEAIMSDCWEVVGPDQFDELFAPFLENLWGAA